MASLIAAPYAAQPAHHNAKYAYVSTPQAPPSPPMDEASKCSLPSISSLLGLADVGSPKQQSAQSPYQRQPSPQQGVQPQQYAVAPGSSSSRGGLPPTPPMQADSAFDGRQSPSASSQFSVASAPGYFFSQQSAPSISSVQSASSIPRRVSMPASTSSYSSSYNGSQYNMPPSAQSSYYSSPVQAAPQVSGLYYQRPLPQSFPPAIPMGIPASNGPNPWQHHHYISPSSQASFPQSQDRYICQTCNKAFSRPSSLRIHSHSHTGEKPFKCPHQGCGKAFSVRSNMKRHERGCHTFEASGSL